MTKYLKFKGASDAWHFETYNKETGENEKYDLKDIAVTEVNYKIMWWDEGSNSAIYSNCITSFNDEEFNVKSKAWTLCSWFYKDIKEEIVNKGAKLHINVTGVQNWEEVNVALKGLNFFQLSETLKDMDKDKNFLTFAWTEDDKKGAVKFKKTIFKKGWATKPEDYLVSSIDEKEMEDVFA